MLYAHSLQRLEHAAEAKAVTYLDGNIKANEAVNWRYAF